MAANATVYQISNGTTLTIAVGAAAAVAIGQLKSISIPSTKADYEDITNLTSPGRYKEWASTLLDAGNATLEGVFNPQDPGQLECFAAFDAQVVATFVLQFPLFGSETTKGLNITFTAFVSERPTRNVQTGKTVPFSCQLKITGGFTEVAGS